MQEYRISFATTKDADAVMGFIDSYWSRGHILASSRKIFLWQYQNLQNKELLNMVLAKDIKNEEILAILGFIKYGSTLEDDVMLALWKSAAKGLPFLGVELLQFLKEQGAAKISCNGINMQTTEKISHFMGFQTGCLLHYYRLASCNKYEIARIQRKMIPEIEEIKQLPLVEIIDEKELQTYFSFEEYKKTIQSPHKSLEFIKYRYFRHPVYQYKVYGILQEGNRINTVLFMREVSCKGKKILRIMDCIGDINQLSYTGKAIDKLLQSGEYEYIDFMQYGISNSILAKAGFIENTEKSGNVIPNYFEPYECSNVKIWFSTQYTSDFIMCKADGDQDRPNKL